MTETEYRIEHDTMGEVRVPKDALYGAQTQRAVENFPISGDGLEPAQIAALARIKKAAALANKELGVLDPAIAGAVAGAGAPVRRGRGGAAVCRGPPPPARPTRSAAAASTRSSRSTRTRRARGHRRT